MTSLQSSAPSPLSIKLLLVAAGGARITVCGEIHEMEQGETQTFEL